LAVGEKELFFSKISRKGKKGKPRIYLPNHWGLMTLMMIVDDDDDRLAMATAHTNQHFGELLLGGEN
jgi:hypothetical protein